MPVLLKRILVGATALGLGAAGFALAAGTVSITLGPNGPQPALATVEWGDTLAFVNGDSVTHTITSSRNNLGPATIAPGSTASGTVTIRAGSYQYRQTGGKSFVGTVVVTATGTVTLKAAKATVVYPQPAVLTGVASKPDTPVLIEQRLTGDTAWRTVGTVTSGADGTFADSVLLTLGAKLRASIAGGQIRSAPVAVALAPSLSISSIAGRTKAGRTLPISARLSPGRAATHVTLFACGSDTGGWRSVAAKRSGLSGRVTFRWKAGYGRTLLRAAVERRYATQGFETQQSRTIAITATGEPPKGKKNRPKRRC